MDPSPRRLTASWASTAAGSAVAIGAWSLLLSLGWACATGGAAPARSTSEQSTLIVGARVVDGSGAPARAVAVRLRDDRIVEVGDLEPRAGEAVLDAAGLVLAPGFIDTHSHHDRDLAEEPTALAAVSQGITTAIVGQDGFSTLPIQDFFAGLDADPPAINLATFTGHNSLRRQVMGEEFQRRALDTEVTRMLHLLQNEMTAGSLGLSTGLEYEPGIYSDFDEILTLAEGAAAFRGRYISHIRSEDRNVFEALDEAIRIGREAGLPVQISHLKLAAKSHWGKADEVLEKLDAARASGVEVSADVYPYEYWQSTLTVLFPERLYTRETARYALEELAPADGLRLSLYRPEPSYVGKTVAEIATLREEDPVATLLALIATAETWAEEHGQRAETVIGTSMMEEDIDAFLLWPHSNLCSDGALRDRHPRGTGAYPRVLGRYVRERGALSLEEAVHKATGLAADHMGLVERGRIEAGAYADLVLFDPRTVLDLATPDDPQRQSTGIRTVWVNGEIVFTEGRPSGRRPGRALRRPLRPTR